MNPTRLLLLGVWFAASTATAHAATYYVDPTAGACSGTYSFSSRNCTGSDGTSFASPSEADSGSALGDTLIYRAGTYSTALSCGTHSCVIPLKTSSTASPRTTLQCVSGEVCEIKPVGAVYPVQRGATLHNYTFQGFYFNGSSASTQHGLKFNNLESGFWFLDNEIANGGDHGILSSGNDWVIRNNHIHDLVSDCADGNRFYAIYFRDGARGLIEGNELHDTAGGGIQAYPGNLIPIQDLVIRNNYFHDNNFCSTSGIGGLLIGNNNHGAKIYNNVFANNGSHVNSGANAAIRIQGGADNTEVVNNTFYQNRGYAVLIATSASSATLIQNNFYSLNTTGTVSNAGTGTVQTTNLSTATPGDCLVNAAGGDFRQKTGTNSCRNVGTAHATRPSPVGTIDIGAYEQGSIDSATVASTVIEVTVNVMTPSVLPATGITGFTIANGTSTGTPVVASAVVKAGSTNIIQLSVSGFTASGTCTISYSGGNVTDSQFIGLVSAGAAQGPNSVSGLTVSGTCANSSGITPPAGLYSEFLLNEGSGTTANDSSGNANHGTVSAGVTWVNDTSGTGVTIPTDATYRHIASTHGSGVNLTTNSLSACVVVFPGTQHAQKVVLSSGGNGTSQRFYAGWATVGGVKQWGIGVQGSTFFSAASEFPLIAEKTLVCIRANAATDTVTLSVGRTIGTSAAAVKTYTSFTLVNHMRAGNDGTFTVNNGGATIYEMWVWDNTYISDADVQALYDSIFPAGGSVACYAEKAHRWQDVYVDSNGDPVSRGTAGEISVVAGGAVALEIQVDCTGSAGAALAVRLWASDSGGNAAPVPQLVDAFGVAMWGADVSSSLNSGTSTCCITGALTANHGETILDSVATETITLSQNHSKIFRWIIKFGTDATGELYTFFLKQDNGASLAGAAATTPQARIIAPQASGGF